MTSFVVRIGEVLAQNNPPLAIDILPGDVSAWIPEDSDCQFLLQEGNLGIPHKVLLRGYIEAVSIFLRSKKALSSIPVAIEEHKDLYAQLTHSTSVILIANPAHQTALNVRKRLIAMGLIDAQRELRVMAAILSTREGAKQSILWHHRRWLLRRLHPANGEYTIDEDDDEDTLCSYAIPTNALQIELSLSTQASETYPRNYFAWNHRYRCISTLVNIHEAASERTALRTIVLQEILQTRKWIELHISDYSAMQYYCRLSNILQKSSSDDIAPVEFTPLEHATALLLRYPEHESLWVYFRSAWLLSTYAETGSIPAAVSRLMFCDPKLLSGLLPEKKLAVENHAQRLQSFMDRTGSDILRKLHNNL
ncbi:hypothetical protein K474DRAFT_1705773 [Panus rudis PR-1116 ss-1]|nr:hypothetical protein K474DRAFT_1705773 [Panus rudis PR-1116 ss-1]